MGCSVMQEGNGVHLPMAEIAHKPFNTAQHTFQLQGLCLH